MQPLDFELEIEDPVVIVSYLPPPGSRGTPAATLRELLSRFYNTDVTGVCQGGGIGIQSSRSLH